MGTGSVLVVDDDPSLLKVITRVLAQAGCQVTQAKDGREAKAMLDGHAFDVILSDISMPGMSGIELLRAVRGQDLDVPVVLISGAPSLESAMQAVEHGALRYLQKPFANEELTRTITQAVKLGQMARLKRQALELLGDHQRQLGDRATREAAFARALATLWMAYQPIVSLSRRTVVAYESLVRNEEPLLRNPAELLDTAEQLGRVHELGRAVRAHVAKTLDGAPADVRCFVNLHPHDLLDPELYARHAPLTACASRVVLEITERASLERVDEARARVAELRALGFTIALDDLGSGYAGLSCFALLNPDVVKLDMSLVRDIDHDTTKQTLVRSLSMVCRDLGLEVVCEGVETAAERDTLQALGCDVLQGYLFARPAPPFVQPSW